MHTVFSLIKYDGLLAFKYFIGNFDLIQTKFVTFQSIYGLEVSMPELYGW